MTLNLPSVVRHILGLTTGMLLSVLAADLLYLYYAGMWYDPICWLVAYEIALLYGIFIIGIIQSVIAAKGLKGR